MKLYSFYLPDDRLINYDFKPNGLFKTFTDTEFVDTVVDLPRVELDSGHYYYLYAITNNKKLAKAFEDIHNMNIFVKTVQRINSDEYDEFSSSHSECVIEEFEVGDPKHKEIKLIVTGTESTILTNLETLIRSHLEFLASDNDYTVLNDEYIEALDYLLYCTLNKINSDDGDFYAYNYSFGITAEGYVKKSIKDYVDLFKIYYNIFSHLLK